MTHLVVVTRVHGRRVRQGEQLPVDALIELLGVACVVGLVREGRAVGGGRRTI